MSKLDQIVEFTCNNAWNGGAGEWISPKDKTLAVSESKQQIKDLMLETYNRALHLYITKQATNMDEGMEKAVAEL